MEELIHLLIPYNEGKVARKKNSSDKFLDTQDPIQNPYIKETREWFLFEAGYTNKRDKSIG